MRLIARMYFVAGLLCVLSISASAQLPPDTKPRRMPEKVAVFAVEQSSDGTSILPITLVHYGSNQQFRVIPAYRDPLPVPAWTEQDFDSYERTYFRHGSRLAVFSGGELVGAASINSSESVGREGGCYSLSASIRYDGHSTPRLATNTTTEIPGHSSTRRAATDTEIDTLRKLARKWLSEYGLSNTILDQGILGPVVATRLRDGAGMALIGRFDVSSQRSIHRLFMIAELQGGSYRLTLADLAVQRGLEDGKDLAEAHYLDQLDLDNDGLDEVVVRTDQYEGWIYTIYRAPQRGENWGAAFTGGGGGC